MIQSILIPRNKFTAKEAIDWVLQHNYQPLKIHVTKNYYRFRLSLPDAKAHYYSKILPNKVELILYY